LKLTPTCIACTLARRAAEIEALKIDNSKKLGLYRDLLEAVSLYIGPDIEVVVLESVVFRRFKTLLGGKNIYDNIIESKLPTALTRAREIKGMLNNKSLEEKLRLSMYAAALASGYAPLEVNEKILDEPPGPADLALIGSSIKVGRDDTEKVIGFLKDLGSKGGKVVYLFGSVFELPYDTIVVEVLSEELGLSVAGVVRSSRYRDYVIASDLEVHGTANYLDEVIDMGNDALTVTKEEHPHIYDQLNEADLVLIKGVEQTIYFHNNPLSAPYVYMFMAPCIIVSRALNVPIRSLNIYAGNMEESQSG
jgi:uncharacterized protein with ATP-grasp and redox domains